MFSAFEIRDAREGGCEGLGGDGKQREVLGCIGLDFDRYDIDLRTGQRSQVREGIDKEKCMD